MPTSLGPAEIMVILVVALIVLGPKRLPEAGRQVGKAIAEVRKWSQGFQDEMKSVIDPVVKAPSYSDPQPGYTPPIPMVPAETSPAPPPEEPSAAGEPPPPESDGSGTVTTGSHGVVSEAAPAADPLGYIDAGASDPYEPPSGDPPRT